MALVSVSVPESRLNRSLSIITGAQYIGSTAGPAVGAVLVLVLNFRAAILLSSVIPLLTGTAVLLFVPADKIARRESNSLGEGTLEPFRISLQFLLGVGLYFMLFTLNQLTRFATPIALRGISEGENVAAAAGLTFSLAGLVSAFSVLVLAPYLFKAGHYRPALVRSCMIVAAGLLILALAGTTPTYILGFLVIALVLAAMTPAINVLIAASVSRSRRGTAFGVAGSAQALASMLGPTGAAVFAAVSLSFGFALLAALLMGLAFLLFMTLREPRLE